MNNETDQPLDFVDSDEHVAPFEIVPVVDSPIAVIVDPVSAEDDVALVLTNLKELVTMGTKSLKELAQLATSAESARAYEVLTATIKTLSDVNKDILDVHKKRKELNDGFTGDGSDSPAQHNTQINNYFEGTAADLNRRIEARVSNVTHEPTANI